MEGIQTPMCPLILDEKERPILPPRHVDRVIEIVEMRQHRRSFFPPAIFGEPAWEMLLALYIAEEHGPKLSVTSLCQKSGSAPTSALRWVHFLEAKQLICRAASPVDRRISYVDLTDKARLALDQFLLEMPVR